MKKRKIAVVTGTRAEYGLLYWTMKEIEKSQNLDLQLIVTGMHLSSLHGSTYRLIEQDGFDIKEKVDMQLSGDTPEAIARSMGIGLIGFSGVYGRLEPDILLVLGDRYEILTAVSAAIPFKIPVAHISGGEVTEGAVDELIRHAITKMAHIHFPGAGIYAENIRRMGEESWRIHRVGDPGLENIKRMRLIDREKLFGSLGIDPGKRTFLVTLHPTTLNTYEDEKRAARSFFKVLRDYENVNMVVSYPNSDNNSSVIIEEIRDFAGMPNVRVFENLGSLHFLSLMKECDVLLGNSSSGIVEAPFFKTPVIDYGDRQKGRYKAENILHVDADEHALKQAIETALYDNGFKRRAETAKSIYGESDTSRAIVEVLENIPIDRRLLRKKLCFEG